MLEGSGNHVLSLPFLVLSRTPDTSAKTSYKTNSYKNRYLAITSQLPRNYLAE